MTLALQSETGVALQPLTEDPTGGRLVAWAQAASAANSLAKALVTTDFVPKQFEGSVGNATAAILMGDELGLSPLASLRSIFVVHGTPSMYARTMVALAQSHGHEIWTEIDTPDKVAVCGRRRGSDKIERSEWTIARARQAGYTNNKKYTSNPQEMLYAKAASTVSRKVAADVLAGCPYSAEELELDQPAPTTPASRTTTSPTSKAKRATAAPPEPEEPSLDEPAPDAAEPESETGELITDKQLKLLHVLLGKNELSDRADGLAYISGVVGRDVDTSKGLTKAEASRIIDGLHALDDEPPQALLDEIAAEGA